MPSLLCPLPWKWMTTVTDQLCDKKNYHTWFLINYEQSGGVCLLRSKKILLDVGDIMAFTCSCSHEHGTGAEVKQLRQSCWKHLRGHWAILKSHWRCWVIQGLSSRSTVWPRPRVLSVLPLWDLCLLFVLMDISSVLTIWLVAAPGISRGWEEGAKALSFQVHLSVGNKICLNSL